MEQQIAKTGRISPGIDFGDAIAKKPKKTPKNVFPAYDAIPNNWGTYNIAGNEYYLHSPGGGFYVATNFAYGRNASTASAEAAEWQKDEWKIHASLMRPENSADPESVSQARQNIALAWELAVPIVAGYGIRAFKIIDESHIGPGFSSGPEQSKKNIVYYFGQHDEKDAWQNMLSEIEAEWRKHGVRPGEPIGHDNPVEGSRFFYASRGQKDGKRLPVAFRDEAALAGGPFKDIVLSYASASKQVTRLQTPSHSDFRFSIK